MPKKKGDANESKVFAWLATFFTVIGFIIVLILKKNDEYVTYYSKQGIVLFIGFVIGGVFQAVPVIGQLFVLFVVVLWVFSWVNALSGKKRRTWIVQDLAERIKL
ncbi:MAG: hypothetical protein KKE05_06090 [Nanoarchaeota archaeon]|nr:hypothetical protein [Nanoarchaeota archaeon]